MDPDGTVRVLPLVREVVENRNNCQAVKRAPKVSAWLGLAWAALGLAGRKVGRGGLRQLNGWSPAGPSAPARPLSGRDSPRRCHMSTVEYARQSAKVSHRNRLMGSPARCRARHGACFLACPSCWCHGHAGDMSGHFPSYAVFYFSMHLRLTDRTEGFAANSASPDGHNV